tara:strand:- start:349 stop:555 length:207 start_codon:yes stop_codon:yes gene_type:complete
MFIEKKHQRMGDNIMTREEEKLAIQEYIKKNGTTKLPPDERGPDFVAISAWGKPKRKKAKKEKKAKKK